MVEFLQQYGSYISAIFVIIFQLIKAIINNKKMNNKFDKVSIDKTIEKIDYKKLADEVIAKLDQKAKSEVNCEKDKRS